MRLSCICREKGKEKVFLLWKKGVLQNLFGILPSGKTQNSQNVSA
jgi:hypothetical protein